jgi:uncharacterized protein
MSLPGARLRATEVVPRGGAPVPPEGGLGRAVKVRSGREFRQTHWRPRRRRAYLSSNRFRRAPRHPFPSATPPIMLKHLAAAAVLAFAAALPAPAQESPAPGAVAAARELLEASRARETFIRALELGMEEGGGVELTPALRRTLGEFMDEHFRYEDLEPAFVRMYTDLFTEEEMRGIIAFYRTPVGQRLVERTPEMAAASQRIANERLQAVMPLLVQMLTEQMGAEN